MGTMFRQLFAMFTVFFTAGGKLAGAADHLATWAEESAGAFADEARTQRQMKLKALQHEARQQERAASVVEMATTNTPSTTAASA